MTLISYIDAYLATFFLLIGVNYSTRIIGMRHRDHQPRIHYGNALSRAWFLRWTFNLFRLAILLLLILRLPFPSIDSHLLWVFTLDNQDVVRWIGVILLTLSAGLISYVHSFMSSDWHSGIDRKIRIITTGPFKRSRHPLFQSIMLGMLGLALALPSLFTLICCITGITVLTLQAKLEEQKLMEHPDYQQYSTQTPRWIWGRRLSTS